MEKHENPYEVLGVSMEADEALVKKAYRKLAFQYHPDKQQSVKPNQRQEQTDKENEDANQLFVKINEAYAIVTDPVKRYDWRMKYQEISSKKTSTTTSAASCNTSTSAAAGAGGNPPTQSYPRAYRAAPPQHSRRQSSVPRPPVTSPRASPRGLRRHSSVPKPTSRRTSPSSSATTGSSKSSSSSSRTSTPPAPRRNKSFVSQRSSSSSKRNVSTENSGSTSYSYKPNTKEDIRQNVKRSKSSSSGKTRKSSSTSPRSKSSSSNERPSTRYSLINKSVSNRNVLTSPTSQSSKRKSNFGMMSYAPKSAPSRTSTYSSKPGIKEFLGRPPLSTPTTPKARKSIMMRGSSYRLMEPKPMPRTVGIR